MFLRKLICKKIKSIANNAINNAIDAAYLNTFLQEPSIINKTKLGILNKYRKKNPCKVVKTNNSPYKQGVFKPKNSLKFEGTAAVYRSSYELKFFRWCDENPNVVKWGSENIIIPYVNPNNNKPSRYFVDNFIILKEGDKIKRYLIEIKPKKHTSPPDPKRYRNKNNLLYEQAMFNQNQAKWAAAEEWSKRHGAEFVILTEKELNI